DQVNDSLNGRVEKLSRQNSPDGPCQKGNARTRHAHRPGRQQHQHGRGHMNPHVALGAEGVDDTLDGKPKTFAQCAGTHGAHGLLTGRRSASHRTNPAPAKIASSRSRMACRAASSSWSYPSRCNTPWTHKYASSRSTPCPYSSA